MKKSLATLAPLIFAWLTFLIAYLVHLFSGWQPPSTLLHFGFIPIHATAVLTTLAILLALATILPLAPQRHIPSDQIWHALTPLIFFGLIGARLYHILTPSPSLAQTTNYLANPTLIFAFARGGLGLWGAITAVAMWLIFTKPAPQRQNWLALALIALTAALSIGRWAHFFAQDLYGYPTQASWGYAVPTPARFPAFATATHYHPLFLYESTVALLLTLFLCYLWQKNQSTSHILQLGLILYATLRIFSDVSRLDTHQTTLWGYTHPTAVWVALALLLAMLIWHTLAHWVQKKPF